MAHRTDWLHDSKYGVFVHFLNGLQNDNEGIRQLSQGKQTTWDEYVSEFNVEHFAGQIEETGAAYLIFTIMQMTKYFCVPCATFDRMTGYKPGEACARRDLVADLYEALNRRGIRLMLYTTGDGSGSDEKGSIAMGGGFPFAFNEKFGKKWAECNREFSLRYGAKVSGWWVDGCYVYKGYSDETFFRHMAPALRAGNPETLIAFNYWAGARNYNGEPQSVTKLEDYTAGEIYQGLDLNHPYPSGRWVDHDQWHALAFLGKDWAFPDTRYPDGYAADYVKKCADLGGTVTIEAGLYRDGTFSEGQMRQMREIRKAIR